MSYHCQDYDNAFEITHGILQFMIFCDTCFTDRIHTQTVWREGALLSVSCDPQEAGVSDKDTQLYGNYLTTPADNGNSTINPPTSAEPVTSTPKPEPSFGIIDEGSRFSRLQAAQTRG